MKLRARAAEAGAAQTIRLEVPAGATLAELRSVLSRATGVPEAELHVSLNKRDEIHGDGIPLSALGICSGDLVYYIVTRNAQGYVQGNPQANIAGSSFSDPAPQNEADIRRQLCASAADKRQKYSQEQERTPMVVGDSEQVGPSIVEGNEQAMLESKEQGTFETNEQVPSAMLEGSEQGTLQTNEQVPTDMLEEQGTFQTDEQVPTCMLEGSEQLHSEGISRSQVPSLLSRLLTEESRKVKELPALLALAVHAVMLETGFVVLEYPKDWELTGLFVLSYSFPELLEMQDSTKVTVSFQRIGRLLVVYGSVTGIDMVYRVTLSVSDFLLDSWHGGDDPGSLMSQFKDVFALWMQVKDTLAVPLLVQVCEKGKLTPPASFQVLPTELKVKILELLPPLALAACACVSSELRFLASSDALWKQKFISEFNWEGPDKLNWKLAFASKWMHRRRSRLRPRRGAIIMPAPPFPFRASPFPGIIGGVQDLFPPFRPGFGGGQTLFGPGGQLFGLGGRRRMHGGAAAPGSAANVHDDGHMEWHSCDDA